ncbi:MAG: hypothetical protein KGY66_05725 [Candidatus Thermoplasmatota archaeon]|nr:hypothetical protein [Candidatus Thermoplasmatota archaeon]MBS3790397.1 hypothetical protein [Candidatus Thermoplasmatota archaeon]
MERHIDIKGDAEENKMVKLRPDKMNLVEDYSAPPTVFKNMGLYLGDRFENKEGVKLKVVEKDSGEWSVRTVDD